MIYNSSQFSLQGSGEVISITSPYLFDQYYNFYYIEDYIKNKHIQPRFKIYVLNADETEKYEIPNEDIIGGSYSENYQSGQRRTLSFQLNNNNGEYTPSINHFWTGQKFSFYIGFNMNNDENSVIWFRKGIYSCQSQSVDNSADTKTVSIETADKFSVLEGKSGTLEYSYTINAGEDIEEVINNILNTDNGSGFMLDSKDIIYNSLFKGKKVISQISESAGATYGSIILKLAEMLSAEVFYNVNGNLTLIPKQEVINDADKPILFSFNADNGDLMTHNYSFSFEDIVNKVIVIGSNVNGNTCRATAVNNAADSPISVSRIGYRTGSIINDSSINSDYLAQERADYELRKVSVAKTSVSNTMLLNPLIEVNNLIEITDSFYGIENEKFLVQSISFSLDYSGIMSISSSNINNLSFTNR